jgi:hypothetical protein
MNRLPYRAWAPVAVTVAGLVAGPGSTVARPFAPAGIMRAPPFNATLSNLAPLAFGMDVEHAARALGTPLNYLRGRPGNEIYLAFRYGGGGLFPEHHRLYLQFRRGRLTGWKGDWGDNWMWQ